MGMMVLNPVGLLASQVSLDPILIFIMLKMFSDTFLKKILLMMTFSRGFSAVRRRKRTLHLVLEAEVLVLLRVIHFFQVESAGGWAEVYLGHRVCLKMMIFFHRTGEVFRVLDRTHLERTSIITISTTIQDCQSLYRQLQERCKIIN